jgi:hypothetical protein
MCAISYIGMLLSNLDLFDAQLHRTNRRIYLLPCDNHVAIVKMKISTAHNLFLAWIDGKCDSTLLELVHMLL